MVEVQNSEVNALALLNNGLRLFIIVGFPWLHPIQSLTVDQKQPEGISGLRYEGSIEINKINSLKSV